MNERLITESGIFSDGLSREGVQSANMSQHATSHTIMADVARRESWGAMADYAASLGMKQGPMTVDILMEALFKAGRGDAAVHILTNPDDYSFGRLILDGHTYTWENWQAGSQSHGWGSASLWQIIEYISGVKIIEPGAAKIRIAPAIGAVESAESRTYTARGAVDISYSGKGKDYKIAVDVPAGMTAEIVFPLVPGGGFVEISGRGGERELTDDGEIITVGSGRRSFTYKEN
jgi:alpha-L-rhamnosidase